VGTAKWVHQSCLRDWVRPAAAYTPLNRVFKVTQDIGGGLPKRCPQCKTAYTIVRGATSVFFRTMSLYEQARLLLRHCSVF
jgi:hypothetical protein